MFSQVFFTHKSCAFVLIANHYFFHSELSQITTRNPDTSIFVFISHSYSFFFFGPGTWYFCRTNTRTPGTWRWRHKDRSTRTLGVPLKWAGCREPTQESGAAMSGWIGAERRRPRPHNKLEKMPRIQPRSFSSLFPHSDHRTRPSLCWFHVKGKARDDSCRLLPNSLCVIWRRSEHLRIHSEWCCR